MSRDSAPPRRSTAGAGREATWRGRLSLPKGNRSASSRKGVKLCTAVVDGQRCRNQAMDGVDLCGPHHDREERRCDEAAVTLARSFGTPDDPVMSRIAETSQLAELREFLGSVQRDLDRGRVRTAGWHQRVRRAAARRRGT